MRVLSNLQGEFGADAASGEISRGGRGGFAVDYVGFAYAGLEGGLQASTLGSMPEVMAPLRPFRRICLRSAGDSGFGSVDVAADAVGVAYYY